MWARVRRKLATRHAPKHQIHPGVVASWLGIAIFLLFGASVSLFSQLERKRFQTPQLPADLGRWLIQPRDAKGEARLQHAVCEQRHLLVSGHLFRRARLVQQTRYRDPSSGQILEVGPEVTIARWFEL